MKLLDQGKDQNSEIMLCIRSRTFATDFIGESISVEPFENYHYSKTNLSSVIWD